MWMRVLALQAAKTAIAALASDVMTATICTLTTVSVSQNNQLVPTAPKTTCAFQKGATGAIAATRARSTQVALTATSVDFALHVVTATRSAVTTREVMGSATSRKTLPLPILRAALVAQAVIVQAQMGTITVRWQTIAHAAGLAATWTAPSAIHAGSTVLLLNGVGKITILLQASPRKHLPQHLLVPYHLPTICALISAPENATVVSAGCPENVYLPN